MSEEAFKTFDSDWFFDYINVSDEDGCSEEAILGCLTNEISDFYHDCVIYKSELGSQLGNVHTLIHGVFVS